MFLTPYEALEWAYQLHYHICFRTHCRRDFFAADTGALADSFRQLYDVHGYRELEMKLRPSDVQLLLSLRPEHTISAVLKKLKGRSSAVLVNNWIFRRHYGLAVISPARREKLD